MYIPAMANNDIYIKTPENPELITKNPGKGWIRYGVTNSSETPEYSEKALYYSKTGYMRYNWADIEPKRGVFNWEPIDSAIEYWDSKGIQFAFRIMTTSTGSSGDIEPQWIYDEGVPYEEGIGGSTYLDVSDTTRVPYYNHPKYMELYKELITAMAERYDGDPRIAYIDIGSYGNWGEFHVLSVPGRKDSATGKPLVAMNEEEMQAHIKMHTDAFRHTQLLVAGGAWYDHSNIGKLDPEWLIEQGVGMRNDGGYDTFIEEASYFRNELPSVDEVGPPYDDRIKQLGPWDNLAYINYVKHHAFSYLSMGEWGTQTEHFIRDEEAVIKYLTNKMGYHFVLNGVTLPGSAGSSFDIKFDWINKGFAPLFENCLIDVAFLNEQNQVVKTFRSGTVPTKEWLPDEPVCDIITIDSGKIPNGKYKLAIGLQQDTYKNPDDGKPDFKIGNYGITEEGWYVFANATKKDNVFTFEPYIEEVVANGNSIYINILHEDGTDWYPAQETLNALGSHLAETEDGNISVVLDTATAMIDTKSGTLTVNGKNYNGYAVKNKNNILYISKGALNAVGGVNITKEQDKTIMVSELYTPQTRRYLEISNPDFETDNNSWSYDDSVFSLSAEDKAEGEKSLKFNGSGRAEAYQSFEFDPGMVYNMKFKIKSEGPVAYKFVDGNNRELISGIVDATYGEWKEHNFNFDYYDPGDIVLGIPMSQAKAKIVFCVDSDSGIGFIDDISISEVGLYETFLDEGNLIKDYGAEVSLTNSWENRGVGKVVRSSQYAKEGMYSYCLSPDKAWDGMQFDLTSALEENGAGIYKISAWMRTADIEQIDYISFYGLYYGGGQNVTGIMRLENENTVTNEWKYFSTEFEITETMLNYIKDEATHKPVTLIGFGEHIEDENGNPIRLYIDEVELIKVK